MTNGNRSINTEISKQLEKLNITGVSPTELLHDTNVINEVTKIGKPKVIFNNKQEVVESKIKRAQNKRYHSWGIDECDFWLINEKKCFINFNSSFDFGSITIKKTFYETRFVILLNKEDNSKVIIGHLFWGIFKDGQLGKFSNLDFSKKLPKEKVTPIINFKYLDWNNLPNPINDKQATKELILDLVDEWYKKISSSICYHTKPLTYIEEEILKFNSKTLLKEIPGVVWYKQTGTSEVYAIRSKGETINEEKAKTLLNTDRVFGKALLMKDGKEYRSAWRPNINTFSPAGPDKMRMFVNILHSEQVEKFNNK
jgi:hypothetical protein